MMCGAAGMMCGAAKMMDGVADMMGGAVNMIGVQPTQCTALWTDSYRLTNFNLYFLSKPAS